MLGSSPQYKIVRPTGTEYLANGRTDGQIDVTKIIIVFRCMPSCKGSPSVTGKGENVNHTALWWRKTHLTVNDLG